MDDGSRHGVMRLLGTLLSGRYARLETKKDHGHVR